MGGLIMMNQIYKWLLENYPVLFWCVALIVIVWLVAKFYYQRFKKVETKVNELPCAVRESQYTQIKDDLLQIKMFLMMKNPKTATMFSEKHSPRLLNEAGKQLFQDVNGDAFLDANSVVLLDAIAKKTPKTALDVEVGAHEVLVENLNSDIFNEIKNWVYNSPTRKVVVNGEQTDYAVTLGDVCFVLSIPLRDRYLKMHPEISIQ